MEPPYEIRCSPGKLAYGAVFTAGNEGRAQASQQVYSGAIYTSVRVHGSGRFRKCVPLCNYLVLKYGGPADF